MELRANLIYFFFGILLWVPLAVTLVPIYVIFFILSRCVHLIAANYRPDLLPISKVDSFLAFSASNQDAFCKVNTAQIWKVQGHIDVTSFRAHFNTCFLSTEEDRKKYVNLFCYFEEYMGFIFKKQVNNLNLENHIQELILDENTTVEQFVGNWMMKKIVDEKTSKEIPLWLIKIIHSAPRRGNGEMTTIVFKLHHGICDGYTMVHLVSKLSGQSAPYLFKEPSPPALQQLKYLIQFPSLTAELWLRMYLSRDKTLVQAAGVVSHKEENWMISFSTLDLEMVKQIRRVTKTNFVTVLMSIQIGALRRLLQEFDVVSVKQIRETFLAHSMGWACHPVMMNRVGMQNHLVLNVIPSSIGIDDPLERLLSVDNSFRMTKLKGYHILTYHVLFNMFKYQPGWISRQLIKADFAIVSMESGLSTLLCSSNQHYLMGHPVENLYLPVITPSISPRLKMMTVPVSHSGILDISVNASSALVRDQVTLDRLTKVYFPQELEELRKQCQVLIE